MPDKRPIILLLLAIAIELMAVDFASGALISGEVYDFKLEKIDEVIVFVDSEPVQRYIVKNHTYYFELPPGTYTLTARTFDDTTDILGADEEIHVKDEGNFVFDLILAPVEPGDTSITSIEPEKFPGINYSVLFRYTDIAAIILLVGISAYIAWRVYNKRMLEKKKNELKELKDKKARKKKQKKKNSTRKEKAKRPAADKPDKHKDDNHLISGNEIIQYEETEIDTDDIIKEDGGSEDIEQEKLDEEFRDPVAQAVLNILKKEKRITQKEIRKQLPDSEAKISLVISEFESKGIIKKIKKGRGNIIIYNS
ncbi:hypothetical protein JXB31_04180 [Candidatus Woesearchaeota archaeon]|nr:hypothetical protein [Candidatus Woesearchaeota archaeon]